MLNVAKGLALVISGLEPIYFTDTPEFNQTVMGSLLGSLIPGFDIPNTVLILFGAALDRRVHPVARRSSAATPSALGSNEEAARLSGVNTAAWKIRLHALRACSPASPAS